MEQNAFNGQLITGIAAFIGIGTILVSLGRLMQKVDTVSKDLETVKSTLMTDIEHLYDAGEEAKNLKEQWQSGLIEKINDMSQRITKIETTINFYVKSNGPARAND